MGSTNSSTAGVTDDTGTNKNNDASTEWIDPVEDVPQGRHEEGTIGDAGGWWSWYNHGGDGGDVGDVVGGDVVPHEYVRGYISRHNLQLKSQTERFTPQQALHVSKLVRSIRGNDEAIAQLYYRFTLSSRRNAHLVGLSDAQAAAAAQEPVVATSTEQGQVRTSRFCGTEAVAAEKRHRLLPIDGLDRRVFVSASA